MSSDAAVRADALWRAMTYLSVAQLHLSANPLTLPSVDESTVKSRPSGHWGTVPGTAWALAHIGLAAGSRQDSRIIPILGAGHAGVVQRSLAWLTGDLAKLDPRLGRDVSGLTGLVSSFPDMGDLGSEVHPLLPGGIYQGGWLGGALAFGQGVALGGQRNVSVPVLGDGECETPTTAAAWLAHQAIPESNVLPIIHLNGYRMGGPSLLGRLDDERLRRYFVGLGWTPLAVEVTKGDLDDHDSFHQALVRALAASEQGARQVIVMRCVKGWSGPVGAHKTPLTNLAADASQRSLLQDWLSSYRPSELFDQDAAPVGDLAIALDHVRYNDQTPHRSSMPPAIAVPRGRGFAMEIGAVLRAHAATGDFRVFSPDELRSNKLGDLADEPWVHEVLAEELLLGWLAGWTAIGGRGVLISYEAFGSLLVTGLVGHLKQRRLARGLPSINLLLTSYGWQNVYTHADSSLVTALLGLDDPAVRVLTPADTNRAAIVLDDALRSTGRVNVILAGKHAQPEQCHDAIDDECRVGLAVWEHLSDPGEPDLIMVCAGDLAAATVADGVNAVRARHSCRVRVVGVLDLAALARSDIHRFVGADASVLVVTVGHPAGIWGILRGRFRRAEVIGWREPPHPMAQDRLASYAGMDTAGLVEAARTLLSERQR